MLGASVTLSLSQISIPEATAALVCTALRIEPGSDPVDALEQAGVSIGFFRRSTGLFPSLPALPGTSLGLLSYASVAADLSTQADAARIVEDVDSGDLSSHAGDHLRALLRRVDAQQRTLSAQRGPLRAGNGLDPSAAPFPVPDDVQPHVRTRITDSCLEKHEVNVLLGRLPRFTPWPLVSRLDETTLRAIRGPAKLPAFFRTVVPNLQRQLLDVVAFILGYLPPAEGSRARAVALLLHTAGTLALETRAVSLALEQLQSKELESDSFFLLDKEDFEFTRERLKLRDGLKKSGGGGGGGGSGGAGGGKRWRNKKRKNNKSGGKGGKATADKSD
ncbi:MAG: hypothetical protein GY772_02715 [bacterium]|nr:hypothetical protein [bacterium]